MLHRRVLTAVSLCAGGSAQSRAGSLWALDLRRFTDQQKSQLLRQNRCHRLENPPAIDAMRSPTQQDAGGDGGSPALWANKSRLVQSACPQRLPPNLHGSSVQQADDSEQPQLSTDDLIVVEVAAACRMGGGDSD